MGDDVEARLREAEIKIAVHEQVCAERYKGITWRQNLTIAMLVALLGAAAAGNPLVAALQRVLGGH